MSNRLIWLSDLHLDHCDRSTVCRFMDTLDITDAQGIVITGDIGKADSVVSYLENMSYEVDRPIYFVLGNHDYYNGSMQDVHLHIEGMYIKNPRLRWLRRGVGAMLSDNTVLIGMDGWCDGQLGDIKKSRVLLNDFVLIDEWKGLTRREIREDLLNIGRHHASVVSRKLKFTIEKEYKNIILATHVPPFAGAAWHEGKQCDDDHLPYFACKAMGDVILEVMKANPDVKLTVLCGHTHSGGTYSPLPNVTVLTAQSEYGKPVIQKVLDIE